MDEHMTWWQVVDATQITAEQIALLEHYGAFPRHHGEEHRPFWLRADVEAWLSAHPVTHDLDHPNLRLCERLLGPGEPAIRAAAQVDEIAWQMSDVLERAGFKRQRFEARYTVALALLVIGRLNLHDVAPEPFFADLIQLGNSWNQLLSGDSPCDTPFCPYEVRGAGWHEFLRSCGE